jgi:NCAIR mutase (PurE)-related protein
MSTELEVRFDWLRQRRTGVPEAVYCEGKRLETLLAILADAATRDRPLLLTRLSPEMRNAVATGGGPGLDYDPVSHTAILGVPEQPAAGGLVSVVCAGSSDLPVAREAQRSLGFMGFDAPLYADVGVAGLWRLLEVAEDLRAYRILIAVAGMEGALFSVLAGLVPAPVIAVPTSVGYGVSAGGQAALSSALATCAPGVVTVNIDNGFGAAAAAVKMLAARPR